MEITSIHKYNTISSTNRVNHVATFKNVPRMFKMDAEEKIKRHIGTDYFARVEQKKTTAEPIGNHINYKTTGKILGYRYLVNMDAPLWTISM